MTATTAEPLHEIAAKTRAAYNAAADRYHELFHDELAGKPYDRALLDHFASLLGPGSRVLDTGCGPCAHVASHLASRGCTMTCVDISDRCVELAREHRPDFDIRRADIAHLPFADRCFDGVVACYSIIDTPKNRVPRLFEEFARVLHSDGLLLLAVKAGTEDGYHSDLLGVATEIYFASYSELEIRHLLESSHFVPELLERRNPYDAEIRNDRIYAIARRA